MDPAGKIKQTPGEFPPARTMALRLRPGEKLVRYWDNVGKNVIRGRRLYTRPFDIPTGSWPTGPTCAARSH